MLSTAGITLYVAVFRSFCSYLRVGNSSHKFAPLMRPLLDELMGSVYSAMSVNYQIGNV